MLAPLLALAALSLAPLPVEPEADPFAKRDPFLKISADDLRTRWSAVEHDESDDHVSGAGASSSSRHSNSILDAAAAAARTSLNGRLAALDALRETTYVDVRLVGFDGDGEHELHMSEDVLQRLSLIHI